MVGICADTWATRWVARLTQLFEHHYLALAFPSDAELSQPIFLNNATIGQTHFYTVQTDTLIAVLASAMRKLGIEPADIRNGMPVHTARAAPHPLDHR